MSRKTDPGRAFPRNIEAERAVLGAILVDNRTVAQVADVLRDVDFYAEKHRRIYGRMVALSGEGRPIDFVTLSESFDREGLLAEIGGLTYLSGLVDACALTTSARDHARLVAEASQRRHVLEVAEEVRERVVDPGTVAHVELMADCQRRITTATARRIGAPPPEARMTLTDHVSAAVTAIYDRADGKAEVGLPTGFADLDRMIGGLKDGRLYVIGGRPAMGKSAKAQRIVCHIAKHSRVPCLYVSTEMAEDEIAERWVAQEGRVCVPELERGRADQGDWNRLSRAAETVCSLPLEARYVAGPALSTLLAIVDEWLASIGGYGAVVVDYLQHVRVPGVRERHLEVGAVSRALKALAGGANASKRRIPVIAVSQLNRALEDRQEKRPTMRDLRESGEVEQDADVILLVYREAYYQHLRMGVRESELPDRIRRDAEVIVAKQRRGAVGVVKERWFGEWTLFTDAEESR